MSNLIDYCKGIFLHVIPVRVIVPSTELFFHDKIVMIIQGLIIKDAIFLASFVSPGCMNTLKIHLELTFLFPIVLQICTILRI